MDTGTEPESNPRDSGFTLVELLVVIVILGVLAIVTMFAVRGISDRDALTACRADRAEIEVAAERYYAAKGSNGTMDELVSAGFLTSPSATYTLTDREGAAAITLTPIASAGCAA